MCATNAFLRSLGVVIHASGHRRWPDEVKAQAVAETVEDTQVAATGRWRLEEQGRGCLGMVIADPIGVTRRRPEISLPPEYFRTRRRRSEQKILVQRLGSGCIDHRHSA